MVNEQEFLEKTNYNNDVYLRCVIVGFLGFLKDRFKWTNHFESGDVEVIVPTHYSLTGDTRFIMDAFYDDIPDKRVNSNTDSIPRCVLTLKSWAVKPDEFTNPNVWINRDVEVDEELKQILTQTKAVPMKLTFTIDTIVDSNIDLFKSWQTYMEAMWIYKYFTFDYKRIPVNAVFNFTSDQENTFATDVKFGEVQAVKSQYTIDVHTFFPIFDKEAILANSAVTWIMSIWQNGQSQDRS